MLNCKKGELDMSQLMEELSFRGLIQQQTDEEGLTKLLAEEKNQAILRL